ncbi:MAG: hypothetical protein C5B54_08385 [Acidobacteria bacterium]|nr:MAG: hypothetical protein C5B54_08385 [Acidobacteriota bacterium]
MKVSVVIETDSIHSYDDIKFEDCLSAVAHQTFPRQETEFIIVQGGKVPDLDSIVHRILPEAKVLTRIGSTKFEQKNLGSSHATGEIIAFIDGDCAAAPNWIEQIVSELSIAPSNVAGLQGATKLTKRVLSNEISALFYGLRRDGSPEYSSRLVTDNCAFRKEIFKQFRFEHSDFSTVSDTLFFLKLRKAGFQMLLCKDLSMSHSFPGMTQDGLSWFFGRAFGVGYYMVKARQIEPELRGSRLIRKFSGIGWPILAAAKWVLDLDQIRQNRTNLQASFLTALPITFLYHPTLFLGGLAALIGLKPPRWS